MQIDEIVLQVVKINGVLTVGIYPPKPIYFCGVENYGLVMSPGMVKHRSDLCQMSLGSL
jgi:hypothetical protein